MARWVAGELNILPSDRESGSKRTQAWLWCPAQKGHVGEWKLWSCVAEAELGAAHL